MTPTVVNNYGPIILIILIPVIVIIFNLIDIRQIIKKHTKGQQYNIREKSYIITDIVTIVSIISIFAIGFYFIKYYINILVQSL